MDEIAKAVAAIRAQGGDDAAVQRYLASIGATPSDTPDLAARARAREQQSAEEKKLTGAERLGVGLQNALGVASFGVGNLAGDAIDAMFSDRTFAANRQARRMTNEAAPIVDRVVSTVGGAFLNPVGAVFRPAQGAGLLARGGIAAADAAVQGGASGAIENLDEFSGEGATRAAQGGLMGMATAVPATALLRGAASAVRGANTLRRVAQAPTLGRARIDRRNAMQGADDFFFEGILTPEARAVGTSPEIRQALASPTMREYAARVRANEAHANKTDAEILLEAYKGMSAAQRAAKSKTLNSADLVHNAQLEVDAVRAAKKRIVPSVAADLPTLPIANAAHAAHRENITAFEDVSDAISRIISKSNQRGKKIVFESPEALEEGIRSMTPAQAEAGIEALLGRAKKTAKFSPTPLGVFFGIPTAALRTAVMPSQVNPYLRLLERQAGRQPRLFDNPVIAERGLGAVARTAGTLSGGLLSDR